MAITRLPRAEVLPTALKLAEQIADVCEVVELAGSLRRETVEVGDIEIVVIPKRQADLFGDIDEDLPTALDARIKEWHTAGRIHIEKAGSRYKRFSLQLPCKIRIFCDLFITTPARWPVIFAIRTGPASYSREFVTQVDSGGLLRNGYSIDKGRLWCEGKPVDLADEKEFFTYVQGGYIEPNQR